MSNKLSPVGASIIKKLRARLKDFEVLSEDEELMMEALDTIGRLRYRDPAQVEAERIIQSAAKYLKKRKVSDLPRVVIPVIEKEEL